MHVLVPFQVNDVALKKKSPLDLKIIFFRALYSVYDIPYFIAKLLHLSLNFFSKILLSYLNCLTK